jgi:hypothetical protein
MEYRHGSYFSILAGAFVDVDYFFSNLPLLVFLQYNLFTHQQK